MESACCEVCSNAHLQCHSQYSVSAGNLYGQALMAILPMRAHINYEYLRAKTLTGEALFCSLFYLSKSQGYFKLFFFFFFKKKKGRGNYVFFMKLKDTGLTFQDIKDKVNKYMIETYERFDFLAETAEGMYIYDENKTPYLDFYAGIAVNSAGNPKVVAAAKDQLDDIMHTFNYPYTIPQALLAEKVCETIGMDKIFYQNSGTEANEAMIKMARKYGIENMVQTVIIS